MVLSPALPAVIHSGDYFLFESDSEEEEEALPEDPRPSAQSAFQVRWEGPLPCAVYRPLGLRSPAWGRTRTLAGLPRSIQTSRARKTDGQAAVGGAGLGSSMPLCPPPPEATTPTIQA